MSTDLLLGLLEHSPLPICVVHEALDRVLFANAACRRSSLVAAGHGDPSSGLPPRCAKFLREQATLRALDAGRVCRLDAEVSSEDGRDSVWLAWRLRACGSEHIALLGCIPDATEQTETRAQLTSLQAALRAKDEFLAELLHELRGPLAPIETAIALLRSPHTEVHGRALAALERQTHHLKRLIEDLFDRTRGSRASLSLHLEPIELVTIIERAVELASPLVHAKQHRVLVNVPRGIVIEADPVRMVQVFSNLITNAAKYSQHAGTIHIAGEVDGRQARVRVKDDGIGIATEVLPRVFELFVRSPRALQREGLGVGLHLVRALVEQHGGQVAAHSDGPGSGSEFTVELPLFEQRSYGEAQAGC